MSVLRVKYDERRAKTLPTSAVQPVDVGQGAAPQVYVRGRRDMGGLKYGIDNLVNYLVKVFFLDTAEAALYVALYVTRNNLALDKAWLRENEAYYHFVGKRIGILWIEPVV